MFTKGMLVRCEGGHDYVAVVLACKSFQLEAPLIGSVYTVAEYQPDCPRCRQAHVMIEEKASPYADGQGFPARWFVQCREADYEAFLEALLPPPSDQPVTG